MRVLIGCPLRVDPKIYVEYRKALDAMIIPEGVEVDYFFIVNNCDEIIPYMRDDEYIKVDTEDDTYSVDGEQHSWSADNMFKMGTYRTMLLYRMLTKKYDYFFSVDSDVIVQPETLATLIQADKDIISEVYWTTTNCEWCNAWFYDQSSYPEGFQTAWKEKGLFQVGMTGACTLIKRRVVESGVTYDRIPNIINSFYGEDRHFCVRAVCHGFELWLDTHYPATHLYREEDYQKYMENK